METAGSGVLTKEAFLTEKTRIFFVKRTIVVPTEDNRLAESHPPSDPTLGLSLGPYSGPREGGDSYERGTPVWYLTHKKPAPLRFLQ